MRHASEHNAQIRKLAKSGVPDPYKRWIEGILWNRGYNVDIPWSVPEGTVQACVHLNEWIAYCPDEECNGAMIVDAGDPVFFCVDCLNADNDEHPYEVVFEHQEEVEALMAMRKKIQHRNWYPDESVEDLITEQIERGEFEHGLHS